MRDLLTLYDRINYALEDNGIDFECVEVHSFFMNDLGLFFNTDRGFLWSNIHGREDGMVSIETKTGEREVMTINDLPRLLPRHNLPLIIAPCFPFRVARKLLDTHSQWSTKNDRITVMGYWDEVSCENLCWPEHLDTGLIITNPKSQGGQILTLLKEIKCPHLIDTLTMWRS